MLHARDQVGRLERLADQLIRLHRERFFRDRFVHHARHQDHGRFAQPRMLFDVLADFVSVFLRHDDVGDDDVGRVLFDLLQRRVRVAAGDDLDVLAPERDLDDFAHRRRVVDEVHRRCRRLWRVAHCEPPSALPASLSSSSRKASSISSVADRITVRVAAVAPGTNLYTPVSCRLQLLTMATTESSPTMSPLSACTMSPASKKMIPSISPAFTCSAPDCRECDSIWITPARSRCVSVPESAASLPFSICVGWKPSSWLRRNARTCVAMLSGPMR